MISQPLEYDADEIRCDHCGQPTPRLTPHAAIDLCDDCYRMFEQRELLVTKYLTKPIVVTPVGGGEDK